MAPLAAFCLPAFPLAGAAGLQPHVGALYGRDIPGDPAIQGAAVFSLDGLYRACSYLFAPRVTNIPTVCRWLRLAAA